LALGWGCGLGLVCFYIVVLIHADMPTYIHEHLRSQLRSVQVSSARSPAGWGGLRLDRLIHFL